MEQIKHSPHCAKRRLGPTRAKCSCGADRKWLRTHLLGGKAATKKPVPPPILMLPCFPREGYGTVVVTVILSARLTRQLRAIRDRCPAVMRKDCIWLEMADHSGAAFREPVELDVIGERVHLLCPAGETPEAAKEILIQEPLSGFQTIRLARTGVSWALSPKHADFDLESAEIPWPVILRRSVRRYDLWVPRTQRGGV